MTTIVLASGRGDRMGGPKALLAWPSPSRKPARRGPAVDEHIPLAIAHARARLAAESQRVVIVVRQHVANVLLGYLEPGIDLVVSRREDELGPAGSLSAAAERLSGESDSLFLVTPVDVVPPSPETPRALVDALVGDATRLAAKPMFEGRGGHPVAVRAEVLARFATPTPETLRDVLHELGEKVAQIAVTDARIRTDLDTPADVALALGERPRFLST